MGISNLSFSATNINVGLDADKSATPRAGDMYLATDTELLYKCYVDDSWVSDELTGAKIDAAKANICLIASDSYTGNNTVNRAIPHGLGVVPKYITLKIDGDVIHAFIIGTGLYCTYSSDSVLYTVTAADSTNFYVGNATDYTKSMNASTKTMSWNVIG